VVAAVVVRLIAEQMLVLLVGYPLILETVVLVALLVAV
jgi:hypothetical protein